MEIIISLLICLKAIFLLAVIVCTVFALSTVADIVTYRSEQKRKLIDVKEQKMQL